MIADRPPPSAVKRRLIDAIGARGPIPFDSFMEAALYGPGGFFSGEVLRSVRAGDFLTSPEVSSLFGATLGAFVSGERARIGEPFRVVEVGAGSGSLLAPLIEAAGVEAWAVELSPPARDALEQLLPPERVVEDLELAIGRGVVIANELLDNLPMAVAVRRGGGWTEQLVAASGEELNVIEAPARSEVAEWADRYSGPVREGGLVEVQLPAADWVRRVLGWLEAGALVAIDYGATAEELESRRVTGTLRTYRSHHLGPDPLHAPGETDITADVNFTALAAVAAQAGATVELRRQDDFLADLGLRNTIRELRSEELELARSGDESSRLQVRSRRIDAEALVNPRGLGDFRVLVARMG
ncbi:MAG: SAM-dependent methyltransferase [Acidimicrobiia bacterium]|nr:SAM-dependent methyltransferase [Acidimicrobiia bacterium]